MPVDRTELVARVRDLPLDSTLLKLDPVEEAFFKAETGIQDTKELREHIIGLQEEAYKVSRWSRVGCVNTGQ